MSSYTKNLHFWWKVASFFVLLILHSFALNSDGVFLLAFKYSILSDPLLVLENWNYNDVTPCSWRGVTCTEIGFPGTPDMFRVTGLVLPNSQLLGSIAADLGKIQHLRNLDLSNNFFNGSLPSSIFNASELQVLSLSNNVISGELPESVDGLASLQVLNLSDNALAGKVPENLTSLQNLTVVSLRSNYFSGNVPSGFNSVQVLDLSSNLLNGSLPLGFGGGGLRYLNLSYNKISGKIPQEFAKKIPVNATVDLSFNNLTGAIPETFALHNQKTEWFSGNADLCGKPLKNLCSIPSTLSTPPNDTTAATSSPAIAAIPKTIDSTPVTNSSGTPSGTQSQSQSGLKPGKIAGIALGDVAGVAVVAIIILYVYQIKKGKNLKLSRSDPEKKLGIEARQDLETMKPPSAAWSCLPIKGEETSEATSSDSDPEDKTGEANNNNNRQTGLLMTVDGEPEMELETLLKASAYILGASGASIVYKALLEDGTALAVRRIGESRVERMRDFETQVKLIAKLRHPNLVRVRGFYWGNDEKLVIYDYVSNGSLANTTARRAGSSPCHVHLAVRLKIARGVARGLAYIHEKKHVHGNIKPSNILLNPDMEPIITDFGLDRLLFGNTRASGSARHFGSYSSTSRDGQQDFLIGGSPSGGSCTSGASPYQAPESLKNLRPNPKWDVFSFGIVLLELLTGRVFSERELSQWSGGGSMAGEERNRMLRMFDVAIRTEVENKEDAMLGCLKLGLSCACFVPQKRPTMKEALLVLDKIPASSISHKHC